MFLSIVKAQSRLVRHPRLVLGRASLSAMATSTTGLASSKGYSEVVSRRYDDVISINTDVIDYNPVFTTKKPFAEMITDPILLEALHGKGLQIATNIQSDVFDKIKSGQDIVIGAETGSGKTLAYTIPLLHRYQ